MPFTPLHFGPGIACKAALQDRFSFTVFALSQALMDVEPGVRMLLDAPPLHPHVHTYAGATAIAVASAWPGRPACQWVLRLWNRRLSPAQARWFGVEAGIPRAAAWTAALLGAYSHVALDSIMHVDIRPWQPLAAGNALLGVVSIEALHGLCVVLGALGLAVLLVLKLNRRIRLERE